MTDHPCPVETAVARAARLGLDCPIRASWCSTHYAEALREMPLPLRPEDADSEAFLLHRDGRLGLYFTPFDWVNVDAVVTLVGLTPGRHQSHLALSEVASALREGRSVDEALRRADSAASFAGSMRTNLVKMLDAIGLDQALGLRSTASLFAGDARLVTSASAILYPVFIEGRNYSGSPQIAASPILRAMVEHVLASFLDMAPNSLIIPFGLAAQRGVELLIATGRVERRRCLLDFPHPSGANGHRARSFDRHRQALTAGVEGWFA